MYKAFTADDYKKLFDLPIDYKIDGMLCYGTWNREKHIEIFKDILKKSNKDFVCKELPDFLKNIVEFSVGEKKFWFDVSYGGTLLSEYLHLACLFGSQKNILLGSCGGLSEKIDSLDLIIPTFSFGNESATRMYNPESINNEHYSDSDLSKKIRNRINDKFKVWEGKTVTCQAMLAETIDDVNRWSKEGFLGVEMEAATLFAVSKHFSIPAATLLVVGDNLIKGETIASDSFKNNKIYKEEVRNEQYRVVLEELLS